MRYEIILSPRAVEDLRRLDARTRAVVRDALETHLWFEPTRVSRSRIKRLHDVVEEDVEILAILFKPKVEEWLKEVGKSL